ncbi:MAG: CYTH domain-containing protein [Minisyncoccia bacterium]|jgi:adenylate cyclase class 2
MNIEYEAKFLDVDKDEIRGRLRNAGADLVRPEYLQKRIPFHLPKNKRSKDAWLRVRDEGDKITLSLKVVDGEKIENQKEICLNVSSFDDAVKLLEAIGCEPKSYQETKRELWKLDGVDITIDEWPFLEPFVEVEGSSEEVVKRVSEKIGFNYTDALFCAVGKLYQMKYHIHPDEINTASKIVFDMENPFRRPSAGF